MKHLDQKNILVLGLGASGLALARWCVRHGARVTVADTRAAPPQLETLKSSLPDVVFVHSDMNEALFASAPFDMVLRSPGLSPASIAGVMNAAEARGTARGNELSLFAHALADLRHDRGYSPQVIGITGTNGKTTVTSLAAQLVQRAGKTVAVAGNIGPTLLDTLAEKLDAALQAQADAAAKAEEEEQEKEKAAEQQVAALPVSPVVSPDADTEDMPDEGEGVESIEAGELPGTDESDEPALIPVMATIAAEPPPLPALPALPEVWVLELSSFQLDGVNNFEPTVATVLNISQDHLDWHETMEAYAQAKNRIYGHGLMLLNRDDTAVMAALPKPSPPVKGKQPPPRPYITFGSNSPERPGDYGIETVNGMAWLVRATEADETFKRRKDEEVVLFIQRLMPMDALRIRGRHNATNALAALGLATAAGCNLAPMLHGLREYRGEPHRVESVAVIRDVEYFDDSKGTNVGATVAALAGLGEDRKLVVIMGGEGKGQDFLPLAAPVSRYARAVVLIGRDGPAIRSALEGTSVPLMDAVTMEEAVSMASQHAKTGDAVLMSPACASFDMFDNYEHRARVFHAAVQALALDEGVTL
ncbi:MAG: UDP-N-acetylmuramoyl-L-alanine--D-glutamate ligase [Polaromonas sp.]|uniref:UDP-N-acetylmuramoyl-L-alanine--D-glutamate ligase n=1 Tax=Polaromonas sp. TaxID=1869339 RepID=UPI0025E6108A|nr:UDP-N-acetylmuramoyl-L-alanine--D-glutamate ligase [Polaromonas sp.]MBI2725991.1 UDP-N-acetylmuramoyl-L-alanine--D-glutamate ligase [Polaromonas sp.]